MSTDPARQSPARSFRRRFLAGEVLARNFHQDAEAAHDGDPRHRSRLRGHRRGARALRPGARIDLVLLAARASGTAGIVRVAETTPSRCWRCSTTGQAGVLVPHVDGPQGRRGDRATAAIAADSRGFSNSPRAGGYGGRRHLAARRCCRCRSYGDRDDRGSARHWSDVDAILAVAGSRRSLHRTRRPDGRARRSRDGRARDRARLPR